MARTKRNAMLIEEARLKIKTSQLVNRLCNHIFSPVPIMDSSQVKAALGLLAKSLPDLSDHKHEHAVEVTSYVVAAPPAVQISDQWARQHVPLLPIQ